MSKPRVGFIGLGVMGFPMAGHLSKKGYQVTAYNRTPKKADQWVKKHKGSKANSLKDIAQKSDIIFTCVGSDKDLKKYIYPQKASLII